MKNYKFMPKHGTEEQAISNKSVLSLGEIAYLTDKRKIIVGNPESEKGFDVVSTLVLGPHDSNFYARLDGHEKYIPVGKYMGKDRDFVPSGLNNWRDSL